MAKRMTRGKSADPKIPAGRWIGRPGTQSSVADTALLHVGARVRTVGYWLPRAARQADDPENVHQLRVSTRRAVETLRIFQSHIPGERYRQVRDLTKRLRRAAGEARDCDVFLLRLRAVRDASPDDALFAHGAWRHVVERLERERSAAHGPIVALHEQLLNEPLDEIADELVESIASDAARTAFRGEAWKHWSRSVDSLLAAADADLSDPEKLHGLRIAAKGLRYTIEIVWPSFPPALRKEVYPRVSMMQDFLGAFNDHRQVHARLETWSKDAPTNVVLRFLQGAMLAERLASADLLAMFLAWWNTTDLLDVIRSVRVRRGRT